jgi:hypothetical protein
MRAFLPAIGAREICPWLFFTLCHCRINGEGDQIWLSAINLQLLKKTMVKTDWWKIFFLKDISRFLFLWLKADR